MKLNLLPTSVNKEAKGRVALIASIVLVLLSALVSVGAATWSANQRDAAIQAAREVEPAAARAVATANEADSIIASAADIIKNTNLAEAMIAHNRVYPDFYDRVTPYIPSFYRINSLSATPSDAATVTLTLTGTIKTHQQYADLMLALMRIPGAQSISRAGYQGNAPVVPSLNQEDQVGAPRLPGEAAPAADPYQRLVALEGAVQPAGFANIGNFGAEERTARGAMPDWSLVTVTVILRETEKFKANLTVPNPRASLSGGGGGLAGGLPRPGGGATIPTAGTPPPAAPASAGGGQSKSKEDE